MSHPLLVNVERTLAREEQDVLRLRATPAARKLSLRRKELLSLVREAARLRGVRLIIEIELAIVRGDLLRYANSKGMRSSLRLALEELLAVQTHLGYIDDEARYAIIDQAHSLKQKRMNGLPRDDARTALASHIGRLGNMDKSRLEEEEKDLVDARKAAMKVAEECYIALQEQMLRVPSAPA